MPDPLRVPAMSTGGGRVRRLILLCAALGLACGDGITLPSADEAAVITWGSTGVLYGSALSDFPNDNLRLIENYLSQLGADRGAAGDLRLLYTSPCDPRTDADFCGVTSDPSVLDPFVAMIDRVGTLTFGLPTAVTLLAVDVVIADFCELDHDAERVALREHLSAAGRVLVLADNFCFARDAGGDLVASAVLATSFLAPYGIEFTALDPQPRDPFAVSSNHPLLEGVQTLSAFRVAPQTITGDARAIVQSDQGVLSAMVSFRAGLD